MYSTCHCSCSCTIAFMKVAHILESSSFLFHLTRQMIERNKELNEGLERKTWLILKTKKQIWRGRYWKRDTSTPFWLWQISTWDFISTPQKVVGICPPPAQVWARYFTERNSCRAWGKGRCLFYLPQDLKSNWSNTTSLHILKLSLFLPKGEDNSCLH